jgi:cell division septation protein DedD
MSLLRSDEADTAGRSLLGKKYPAYVAQTPDGRRYRVRVGKYRSRDEALAVAERLRTVEQFRDAYVTQ